MASAWKKFWDRSWWIKGPAIGLVVIVVIAIAVSAAGGGGDGNEADEQASTKPAVPAATEAATVTQPPPTPQPTQTAAPTLPPEPVVLQGIGQYASDPITLPGVISVATFTHNGSSNFIVSVFPNDDLLINEIGPYQGSRPLISNEPIVFDIDADGAWTIRIEPIGIGAASFSGQGDAVSGLFDPPSDGAWEIQHSGQRNFIVWAHCAGGSDLVQNEIGTVAGSSIVAFGDGPCFWEVEADGSWSLTPR